MPFAPEFREVYDEAIRLAADDVASRSDRVIVCRRGDDIVSPGSVTREIVGSIYSADVVIADLTGNNPNVFYELGVAHTLGNKTIMITQDLSGVPFDVSAYRLIRYDPSATGLARLRASLGATIEAVVTGEGRQPDNPVQDSIPIRISSLIARNEDLVALETQVCTSVWVIQPTFETDLKLYRDAIKENIENRCVCYRYLVPDTPKVLRGLTRLREALAVDDTAWQRIDVRLVETHMIESEVVIYDESTSREQVFLMSSPDEEHPFWYRIRGTRARAIHERYEALWHELSKPART